MTSDWLAGQGITPQMLWGYRKSGWLTSLGRGAWIRPGQKIDWTTAVFALQRQSPGHVWPAARSALSLLGQAHYVPQGDELAILLCVTKGYRFPDWFRRLPFGQNPIKVSASRLFEPVGAGLTHWHGNGFSLDISTPERAALELCAMTPGDAEPEGVKQLVQGLPALRPNILQALLLACRSIKAKRLFMVLAELLQHPWLDELDLTRIDLGTGKRSLNIAGRFHPKYRITVPASWEEHEGHALRCARLDADSP